MISRLGSYVLAALAIVLGGLLIIQSERLYKTERALAKVEKEVAGERLQATKGLVTAAADVRKVDNKLQQDAAETRKQVNDATQGAVSQRDALLRRLRIAEANLATAQLVSSTTGAGTDGQAPSGGDGTELPARLGETDVREAGRAETIRLHLAACYRQYDEAEATLKAFKYSP